MTNLKSLATCLPILFALLAVMAGLVPDTLGRAILMAMLVIAALLTPYYFHKVAGRSLMADEFALPTLSLAFNTMLFTLHPVAWFVTWMAYGLQFPHILMPAGMLVIIMADIAIHQSGILNR